MDIRLHYALMQLPIRARVALGLTCAEHVLSALEKSPEVKAKALEAIQNGWKWKNQDVPARKLYDYIHILFPSESSLKSQQEKFALFAIISALYYVTWHAHQLQSTNSDAQTEPPLPNDMGEVDEEFLVQCLDFSTQAALDSDAEKRWQEETLIHLANFGSS